MRKVEEIYASFRRAQSKHFSRPYRLPKDFDKFFVKNLRPQNREALVIATKFFNTKWRNIDPDRFFTYGFELLKKKFTYKMFFDQRLVKYYIMRDKGIKRDQKMSKIKLRDSAIFIKKWIGDSGSDNISILLKYSHMTDDGVRAPIRHYILNRIDKYFLVWLLYNKYFILEPEEKALVPLIAERYREYVCELEPLIPFLRKIEEKL